MKTETIERLIEKGRQNGAFDMEIARILNVEGVNLIFRNEGIEWKLEEE